MLLACRSTPVDTNTPRDEATVVPTSRTAKRVRTPADAPPRFTDPKRQEKLASAFPAIEEYLAGSVARDHLVGLAAGIVIDGELAWFRSWGHRDPARGLPIEPNTLFGIGSISKTITTMSLLKLREQGRVAFDRPAVSYLPELAQVVYPTADSAEITIRHLLTHTSGLPRMGNFPEYPQTPPTRAEFLQTLDGLGLERAPGERRVYSNFGFQLLGTLIDNVAETDHRSFSRDAILRPMGMKDAVWMPEHALPGQIAVGHEHGPDGKPRPRPHWRPGAGDAAGGLYASMEDLAAYASFHLQAWPPRNEREREPLRRATVREAHKLQTLANLHVEPDPSGGAEVWAAGTGLAFAVYATCRHEYIVGHNGKTLNYRASLHMLPWQGVAVILLSNHSSISSQVLPADGLAVLDKLADTGGLEPRRHVASDALLTAATGVGVLLGKWEPAVHKQLFSDDYRDAHPAVKTEQNFREWHTLVGTCRSPRGYDIAEPRAGVVELSCERGNLRVDLRVAPWDSPGITSLRFVGVTGLEPAPEYNTAAEQALGLMTKWDDEIHGRLFSEQLGAQRIHSFLSAVHRSLGDCRLGGPQLSTPSGVVYGLECEHGDATMRVSLGKKAQGKISGFEIRGEGRRCG